MPRPQKKRSVNFPPSWTSFKPVGIRSKELETISLGLDEFEAIRLADYEGLDHAESAVLMEISRSTFSRLVERARQKVAVFIIEGQRLQIDGGEIHFHGNVIQCAVCAHQFAAPLNEQPTECPACGSPSLIDLADRHGHGHCCNRHHGRNRR